MTMPILNNHDHEEIIGIIDVKNNRLCFKFAHAITKDQAFEIFPTAGILFTESEERDGELFVTAGEILEFSMCP